MINQTLQPTFITHKYTKNDVPPPPMVTEIVNQKTGETIRQIPKQSEINFKKSIRENSIIDIYV